MKKIYITPILDVVSSHIKINICAGSPGSAGESHGGGSEGEDDKGGGAITPTGGSGLSQGTKGSFSSWDDED